MTRNIFRPITNSGIWTSILVPTHTRHIERTCCSHINYSFYFTIHNRIRGEIMVSLWFNSLIIIPCYPRYRFCSLSSFPYSGIPVIVSRVSGQTMIDTVIPSGPWEYLSIVGGANPNLELSSSLTYFSEVLGRCRYDHPVTGNVWQPQSKSSGMRVLNILMV